MTERCDGSGTLVRESKFGRPDEPMYHVTPCRGCPACRPTDSLPLSDEERLREIADYDAGAFNDLSDADISDMARELLAAKERIEQRDQKIKDLESQIHRLNQLFLQTVSQPDG